MNTQEMIRRVGAARSTTEALRIVEKQQPLTPLREELRALMESRNVSASALAAQIEVERSTLYRLLGGDRLTTRNVLLRIALSLGLTLEETQRLLTTGRKAPLYPRVRRDALLIFAMEHRKTLAQTEAILTRMKEASLFERV